MIDSDDIKWLRSSMWPAFRSGFSPAENGGRLTGVEIPTGTKNNLFPDVTSTQRATGIEQFRKVFISLRSDAGVLQDARVSIEKGTPGDSYVLLYPGTQTDTQDQVSGRGYGYATFVGGGGSEIIAEGEADFSSMPSNLRPFQAGDVVRIDARENVNGDGVWEFATIDSVTYNGPEMLISFTAPLAGSYSAGHHVASVIDFGTLAPAFDDFDVTADGSLDYDHESIELSAIGTVEQIWTITVTDASTGSLSVSGDTLGQVDTGATGATLSPINPETGAAYFTMPSSGWAGIAVTGDTVTFKTSPAAVPVWYKRTVKPGASAIADDPMSVAFYGEAV